MLLDLSPKSLFTLKLNISLELILNDLNNAYLGTANIFLSIIRQLLLWIFHGKKALTLTSHLSKVGTLLVEQMLR